MKIPTSNANTPIDQVYLNAFKAMSAFLSGRYIDASEYALASCQIAEELGVEGTYFPFEAAYILIDTHFEFGNQDKSQELVDKYLPKALKYNQFPWITAFYCKAALIKSQSGENQFALSLLRRGREIVESPLFGSNINFVLDSHELMLQLPLFNMERINELLFRLPDIESVKSFKIALEIMQKPAEAKKLAKRMSSKTEQEKFRRELMLAVVLADSRKSAIKHLENAVALAMPNGYFRAFLNLPPQVKTLILELADSSPTIYLENLSRAIRNQSKVDKIESSTLDKPLTKRESIILRRLESGLAINQIADDLSISKNTIKTHLKSIYRKLNADSRSAAVAKAKEMLLF